MGIIEYYQTYNHTGSFTHIFLHYLRLQYGYMFLLLEHHSLVSFQNYLHPLIYLIQLILTSLFLWQLLVAFEIKQGDE